MEGPTTTERDVLRMTNRAASFATLVMAAVVVMATLLLAVAPAAAKRALLVANDTYASADL